MFTPGERGRVKHKYCIWKPFWDLISRMIQNGFTAQVAIDKVYDVYGNHGSVTKILCKIRKDKGGHPELQFRQKSFFHWAAPFSFHKY